MADMRDEMPEGLAFSMAMNEKAMVNFGKMTESQRKEVIEKGRNVTSRQEMNRLVDSIARDSFQG